MTPLHGLAHLSAGPALLMLTLGLTFIYIELNRPGWIIPGAAGLSLALLAVASLLRYPLRPLAVLLVAAAVATLALNLLRPVPVALAVVAVVALMLGFQHLVPHSNSPLSYSVLALGCGLLLGTETFLLARLARRARTNKRGKLNQSAF